VKRVVYIAVAVVVVAVLAGAIGAGFIRPGVPEEWRNVRVGAFRDEVMKHAPDLVDMRELKGFDIATREYRQWGFRKCWWQLMVQYDDSGLVKSVEASFTDPSCGIFNTGWVPLSCRP
jgi:hypothetical protein